MTLGTLLKEGREILQNAGIAEWDLDAWYLLEYVTGVSRSQYFLDPEREVPQEQEAAYRQMIDKRSTHIPLQHLTGHQEFMGLDFRVSEDVLVPRQDTEILVEEALKYLRENDEATIKFYKGAPFLVEAPQFVDLVITDTEPGFAGNTAQGALKPATVETGLVIQVPLFIESGEKVQIDTRTGEYLGRSKE